METAAGTTGELFAECRARHAGLEQFESSLVAINDEMSRWDSGISEGDEVLFFDGQGLSPGLPGIARPNDQGDDRDHRAKTGPYG